MTTKVRKCGAVQINRTEKGEWHVEYLEVADWVNKARTRPDGFRVKGSETFALLSTAMAAGSVHLRHHK